MNVFFSSPLSKPMLLVEVKPIIRCVGGKRRETARAGGWEGGEKRAAVAFDEWAAMHSFSLIH